MFTVKSKKKKSIIREKNSQINLSNFKYFYSKNEINLSKTNFFKVNLNIFK